jgi:hypothetical protein
MGYENRAPQPPIRQFGGLNTRDSELALPGNDSPELRNVELHPEGAVRQRLGVAAQTTPGAIGTDPIRAVMRLDQPEFNNGAGRGWVYIISEGVIYRTLEPGTWSWETPTGTPAVGTLPTQLTYGRENARYNNGTEYQTALYICRNDEAPIVALGQTAAANDLEELVLYAQGNGTPGTGVLGFPASWTGAHWPTHMRLFSLGRGARMHAWGFPDDPNKVYYTALDIPWHYGPNDIDSVLPVTSIEVDGGFYYVNRGDGGVVVSLVDMYSYTVAFKRHRTYLFTGDPGDAGGDFWNPVAEINIGCVSDRAWQKVGNDILFWSEDGPRSLAAVQQYGDLQQANLGFKINDEVTSISTDQYERICSYHDVTNMRVIWYVPENGSTFNNAAYVYYYNTQKWTKWTGDGTQMMDALRITSNSSNSDRAIAGTYADGMVLLQSGRLDTAEDIDSLYITNWINVGEISDATRALGLDVMFGDDGPQVDIYYQTDLNEEWIAVPRLERSMGGVGTAWGNFAWGAAAWGVTGRAMYRYEFDALCNIIRLKFEKTSHLGFEVMGYRLEMRQRGSRA